MMSGSPLSTRELAERLFHAAVAAADPAEAVRRSVTEIALPRRDTWILAIGKAAHAMTSGAREALDVCGVPLAGGVVVASSPPSFDVEPLTAVIGDHPVPGENSRHAARALESAVAAIPAHATVLVLLSGGTTSLIASPVPGVSAEDLSALFGTLLGSGADITAMNALRKRVLRWGAGRLATALGGATLHCFIASDVLGNDPAYIGSGPCSPDPLTAGDVLAMLARLGLRDAIPANVLALLERTALGTHPETPKPGDQAFAHTTATVVLDNHDALAGAARAALAAGVAPVTVVPDPVTGAAAETGEALARALLSGRARAASAALGGTRLEASIWGGETTVRLEGTDRAPGGRCQELALAAARTLHAAGSAAEGVVLLAAGTDGRDGPTDAAGAVVDAATWGRIAAAGRDPAADLERHASHDALSAAGALVRTGLTGTNVNDVMVGLVERRSPV